MDKQHKKYISHKSNKVKDMMKDNLKENFKIKSQAKDVKSFLKVFTYVRAKLIMAFLVPVIFIIILGALSYSKSAEGLIGNYESSSMSNMSNMAKYLDFGLGIVSSKADMLNSNKILLNYYSGSYQYDKMEEMSRYIEIGELVSSNIFSERYIANIFLVADYGSSISGNKTLSDKLVYKDFIKNEEGALLAESGIKDTWLGVHPKMDQLTKWSKDKYAISYMRTLYNNANQAIGCVVLDVSYDYVKEILAGSGLPDGRVIAFITKDGREILSGEVTEEFAFNQQDYYSRAVKSEEANGYEYMKYDGKDYLFVYSKIKTSDSLLCAIIPQSIIVKQAEDVKNITLMIVFVACIIAVALGTFIASGFSNTIHRMIQVLHKTASGDLTNEITVRRRDEFSILSKSINDMTGSMMKLIRKMAGVSKTILKSAVVVSESSDILVNTTQNITVAVGDIEQGVTQQALDAENCLHQMADLAKRINVVYHNANNIEQIASSTKIIVNNGMGIIDDLSLKAKDTTDITQSVILDIENLEKESGAIVGIIETMNGIAEQTNLLSLNASIEAARAGQAGRGFSVVAEEIRKLADQSLKASGEISNIINRIENQTKKTVKTAKYAESIVLSQQDALKNTVDVFTDINGHVENLTENLHQIADGIQGIEHAKDDTLGAIESISATAEETAAAAEQLGVSAEQQLSQANKLNEIVQQLSNDAENLEETVSVFRVD